MAVAHRPTIRRSPRRCCDPVVFWALSPQPRRGDAANRLMHTMRAALLVPASSRRRWASQRRRLKRRWSSKSGRLVNRQRTLQGKRKELQKVSFSAKIFVFFQNQIPHACSQTVQIGQCRSHRNHHTQGAALPSDGDVASRQGGRGHLLHFGQSGGDLQYYRRNGQCQHSVAERHSVDPTDRNAIDRPQFCVATEYEHHFSAADAEEQPRRYFACQKLLVNEYLSYY
jgi:hypothetical protein